MELRDYLTIFREKWILIASAALIGLLAAGLLTSTMSPRYEATSQVYVSVQTQDGSTQNLVQGSTFTQSQVAGFAELATSPLVLQPVAENDGLAATAGALANRIVAEVELNTSLINVTASGDSPEEAAALGNAVARSMAIVLPELQRPVDAAVSPVRITQTREASAPRSAASPDVPTNLALGSLLGLGLGTAIAVLRAILDTRVRTESDVLAITDRPVLGTIVFDRTAPGDPLAVATKPLGHRAEAIRRLRTNLQFIPGSRRPRTIVVTSSLPGEGKSTTAANLALALAQSGSRVVIVDADLRRPAVAKTFGIEGSVGLTTVLIGRAEVDDVVQTWGDSGLDIVAAGEIPPNPSELLGSQQMIEVLTALSTVYDVVILDSAPLLPVTDGAVLAKLADGALVVVSGDAAHKQQLETALVTLETVEARVLGVVLNRVDQRDQSPYRYYDYSEDAVPQSGRVGLSRRRRAAGTKMRLAEGRSA